MKKGFKMKKLVLLVVMIHFVFATEYKSGGVEFSLINPSNTRNIIGNSETVGNTVECVTDLTFASSLSDLKNAQCQNDYTKYYNNKYLTKPVNVLSNKNPSIFNSSSATLKFPSTYKKIIWAAIFWQGHINNYSYQYSFANRKDGNGYDKYYDNQSKDHKKIYNYISKYWHPYYHLSNDLPGNSADNIKNTNANKVTLFLGNSSYVIEADELNYKSDSRYFKNAAKGNYVTKKGVKYSAYAVLPQNIINTLNSLASNKEINVTVANIQTTFGLDEKLGDYGAWSLVVIYQEDINNINSKLRNNSVYYGYKNIYKGSANNHLDISINNLVLPKNGEVNSKLSIFSAEGEYVNHGNENTPESVRINGEFLDENLSNYDKYNVFDGRLSDNIERYPKLSNNNGIDIDVFDVSSQLTKIRDIQQAQNPSQNSYDLNINVSTYNDGVFLSNLAFSTELYKPRVCYYIDEIKDENNNIVFQNGKFTNDINPAKNYIITYLIANMPQKAGDIVDTANDVKVYSYFNQFSYVSNSTALKNIGVTNFIPQTDGSGDDLVTFDGNETILNVGKNASAISGGEIGPSYNLEDNTNKVYVKFKGKFLINNSKTIDLSDFFDFKASLKTDNINISPDNAFSIPKCIEFNSVGNVYIPKTGSFNVVEGSFNSAVDPVDVNNSLNKIHTKIVNKPFDVKIVKFKDDNQTLTSFNGVVRLDLINNPKDENACATNTALWNDLAIFNNESSKLVNVSYDRANKNVRFRVRYFDFDFPQSCIDLMNENPTSPTITTDTRTCVTDLKNVSASTTYNLAHCVSNLMYGTFNDWSNVTINNIGGVTKTKINNFMQCLFNDAKSVCSRDNFAIRPYQFKITQYPTTLIKAGNRFNLKIEALDINGNSVKDYNETVSKTLSPILDYKDINSSAVKGVLNLIGNRQFSNGQVYLDLNYSEVGELNITIKENNDSSTFAKVDEADTNLNDLLIKPASTPALKFIPDHFDVNATYNNFNNSTFTYISNDLNMSSVLNINISAKNKEGKVTQNFTSGLYAKNIVLNISHSAVANDKLPNIKISYKNGSENNLTDINSSKNIEIPFSADNFNNGTANLQMYINFEKDYSNPVSPFDFEIKTVSVKDPADGLESNVTIDKNATFRYGRIEVQNSSVYGTDVNNTVKYEYWTDDKGWIVNTEHNISTMGAVDISNSYKPSDVTIIPLSNTIGGVEILSVATTHSLPYGDVKIHLAIPSWLWYHPLAKAYKAPSSSNTDCLTHPCLTDEYLTTSTGWGGISGISNEEFNATKRTSKIGESNNTTTDKSSKKGVSKLNW